MLCATYSGRRVGLLMFALMFGASAHAETKTITIKVKPGDTKTYTSVKIFKNNGDMTIDAPGCAVAGPAAGATGVWQLTGCSLAAGSPLTITFDNANGSINYRLGGYDYTDSNGNPVWTTVCTDPIAVRVVEGGDNGSSYLGYPIPPGRYGYFYQMFPNLINPETIQRADIYLGPNSGAYNFQVLSNSFPHLPSPGFDLNDLEVPLRDPPDGYEYEVVRYMEPQDATGLPGNPTLWSFDNGTGTATMDFGDAGLSMGQTGSIVAYTSPYAPTMILDNVSVAYEGGVDPPCTGTFVNEAPVPTSPPVSMPLFSFQPLPELPGGASEVFDFYYPSSGQDGSTAQWPMLSVGQSLDGDGINKAVMWRKDPLTTFLFSIDVLPNPFGNTESQASDITCFFDVAINFDDIFCSIGGSVDDLGGVPQPVVWTREGETPWTAETPPLPPGYDSGMATAIAIDVAIVTLSGWVGQSSGPELHHAARWTKDIDSGLWTVELLPDYGPGFYSEGHTVIQPPDESTPIEFLTIGGHVQPDSGFGQLPCVWDEIDGGGYERVDLPMMPGAYLGTVDGGEVHNDGEIYSAVGHNASIAGLADLYRGTLWTRVDGVWGAPLSLPPLPGLRDSKAYGARNGAPNVWDLDRFTVVGHSYIETAEGSERATMWEVGPGGSITAYDLNNQTVDRPPNVRLAFCSILPYLQVVEPKGATVSIVPGTFAYDDSPATLHAHLLVQLSGADCNKNGMDDAIDIYSGTSGDANGNGVPDECDPPLFKFAPLPELLGGQSVVLSTASDRLEVYFDPAYSMGGQALDGDGIWKPAVWLFYPGCLPFEGWMLEVLPNPLGDSGGAALTVEIDRALYPDAWVHAAGYVGAASGVQSVPAFWTRDGAGLWTAELPAPPPPFDSGAFLAARRMEAFGDPIGNYSLCGWVGQSAGPEPHHAVACDMTSDGGGWTALWSLLPDYGPGFFSEATSIAIDPEDEGDPTDDLRIIGGSLQTGASSQAPCIWQEVPGGDFELIELPMVPGAYGGELVSLSDLDNDTGAIDFVRWGVGHNTFPGDPVDLDRAVLYRRIDGVWSGPLELAGLPDAPYGRASGVMQGTSNSPEGVTIVGYSYSELDPTATKATLWEVEPDNSISVHEIKDQTVNLPPGVSLRIADAAHGTDLTGFYVGGTYVTEGSGGAAAAGPGGGPHGYALTQIVPGNCCGQDGQGQPFCGETPDIAECGPVYGGYPVADCNSCGAPPDLTADPSGLTKNRYVSFVVPPAGAGNITAIRVELTSLHHPSGPPNAPNFSAFEGQYRYLNAIRDGANNPVFVCPDSVAAGTSYKCAKLGCTPEYRDWSGIFGGQVVHVTGDSVVPSSQYTVAHLASSCAGNEPNCPAASADLPVSTERWGNVDNAPAGGTPNAIDIGKVVDKVKDLPSAFIEPRCQLREATPSPYTAAVNAQDIGRVVDAVKGQPYPFTISVCP